MMLADHNLSSWTNPTTIWTLKPYRLWDGGLQEYKGTVIVASHDRDLIDTVATKIIAFEADGIHVFDGPLEEYLAKKEERASLK